MENYLSCYWRSKETWSSQLISYKVEFKSKAVTKDDEGLFILIPGSLHQEELKILNVYTPNSETHKYRKQLIKNIQNLVDKNVVIAGDIKLNPEKKMENLQKHGG